MPMTPSDNNGASVAILEQTVERHEADIKRINGAIEGIPQRMTAMEASVEKLCATIEKLLDKSDTKYQTKEMCDSVNRSCQRQQEKTIGMILEELKETQDDLKSTRDRAYGGLIGLLVVIVGYLVAPVFSR